MWCSSLGRELLIRSGRRRDAETAPRRLLPATTGSQRSPRRPDLSGRAAAARKKIASRHNHTRRRRRRTSNESYAQKPKPFELPVSGSRITLAHPERNHPPRDPRHPRARQCRETPNIHRATTSGTKGGGEPTPNERGGDGVFAGVVSRRRDRCARLDERKHPTTTNGRRRSLGPRASPRPKPPRPAPPRARPTRGFNFATAAAAARAPWARR